MRKRWSFDVFCRVVDNYGDIGVSWRLLQRLIQDHRVGACRLWVDDLTSVSKIVPAVRDCDQQFCHGVEIMRWHEQTRPGIVPHDVVIEAFACEPPAWFLSAMRPDQHLWINLEYLSAEAWVEDCHGLPSPQPNGLRKYFFFPGFTAQTGGLIREPGLLAQRDDWLVNRDAQLRFLSELGVSAQELERVNAGARLVLLFCYPDAPVRGLMTALSDEDAGSVVLVPTGVAPNLQRGPVGNMMVREVPFVDQAGFDRLLWTCDLNLVRGEDSWVRAVWAAKPLIWQSYRQDEDAHIDKLAAWMGQFNIQSPVRDTLLAWNQSKDDAFAEQLSAALRAPHWREWQSDSQRGSQLLMAQTDLGERLLEFCASVA